MRNQDLEMRIRGESPGLEARFSQLGKSQIHSANPFELTQARRGL